MRTYSGVQPCVPWLLTVDADPAACREGLCRFALLPYDPSPDRINELSIHLTNYALTANRRIIEEAPPPVLEPIPDDREGKTADELQSELDKAKAELAAQIEAMGPISRIKELQQLIADLDKRHRVEKLRTRQPELKVPQKKANPKVIQPTIKWTLTQLDEHLRRRHEPSAVDGAWEKVASLVVQTLQSAQPTCAAEAAEHVPYRGNCFELFGFDVLLDAKLKPWLIEVNLSPSLACGTPLDHRIKSALIADTLNVVGVPRVHIAGSLDRADSLQDPHGTEEEAEAELRRLRGTSFSRVCPPVDAPFRVGTRLFDAD